MKPPEEKTQTRYLVRSVLLPCLFYKLTLEGDITAAPLQTAHTVETECVKRNTKLGGWTERDTQHLEEDQKCKFLSVRIKQTNICKY